MVNKLAEIEPRTSGETVITNPETGEDFFRPEQLRDTFIFTNNLDEYVEVTIETTHSNDEAFENALVNEEGLPVLPGRTRESAFFDPAELIQITVTTQTAPTSGSLTVWREKDHTPVDLDSSSLDDFKELNDGRTYAVDFQEQLANDGTLTVGIDNPSSSDASLFVRQFGIAVGGDALLTTEIDHGSYTDGTDLTVVNKKPELQVERPIEGSVTKNPTASNPQAQMTAFLPGGSAGGTAQGNRYPQTDYELSPGQNITVEIENDSGSSNRFGFSLEVIETVIR